MRIGWEWWYLWAKVTTDHSPRWLPDIYTESLPTSQYNFKVSTWNHFRCPTKQSGEHFHTVTVTIYCELLPCLDSIYGLVWIAGQIPTLNSNHLHPKLWEKKGNWRKRQMIILLANGCYYMLQTIFFICFQLDQTNGEARMGLIGQVIVSFTAQMALAHTVSPSWHICHYHRQLIVKIIVTFKSFFNHYALIRFSQNLWQFIVYYQTEEKIIKIVPFR